eukprot:GDKJ01031108.1.p1 GENE.GDKJ01031108.1~~GDKJ01031108.1.p1  ORF type:complete len:413 (+),score=69.44 GDKJ01031108.1:92-1240(+)
MDIKPKDEIHRTIVFVHGLGGRAAQFFRVLDRLDLSKTRVLGLNNIGCGESPSSSDENDYSVDMWYELNMFLIQNLTGVDDNLKPIVEDVKMSKNHKIILIGHSFGSLTALRMASTLVEEKKAQKYLGAMILIGFTPKTPQVPPFVLSLPCWLMQMFLSLTRAGAISRGVSDRCTSEGKIAASKFPSGYGPLKTQQEKEEWLKDDNAWNYEESAVAETDAFLLRSTGRSIVSPDGWNYDLCAKWAFNIHTSGALRPVSIARVSSKRPSNVLSCSSLQPSISSVSNIAEEREEISESISEEETHPKLGQCRWIFINGEFDEGMPPKLVIPFKKKQNLRDAACYTIKDARHNPHSDFPAEIAKICQATIDAVKILQDSIDINTI